MDILHPEEKFEKGIMYMMISSAMLSLFTLFGKLGSDTTSYVFLAFLRFGIPLLLLLPYLLWKYTIREMFWTRSLKMQFMRTGCMLLYQYSLFYYLMHSTLLDTTVLQNTSPLFIPVLERFFFKQKLDLRVGISIFVSFVGVLCILQPGKELFSQMSLVGLLAPLGHAGSQVLYGHQARSENQNVNLFYLFFLCSLFSGIVCLVYYGIFAKTISLGTFSIAASLNILALGAVTLLNQSFRGLAYLHGRPSALAPFLYFSLIISGFLDWLIFDRLPNTLTLIGAALVVVGGLIQLLRVRR